MNRFKQPIQNGFLSLLSALLLVVAWQPFGWWFTSFVAFVPLLILHQRLREHEQNVWFIVYLFFVFFTWNAATTYWIWNASPEGSIAAFLINTLLMLMPWLLMQRYYDRLGERKALVFLLTGWLSFELLHLNWEISWPWLTLGNVFSTATWAVQWYEYTGHLGGSLWVLWVNIKVYQLLANRKAFATPQLYYSRVFNFCFLWLFTPLFLSWFITSQYTSAGLPIRVLVVQPNIDPYTDKFGQLSAAEQTLQMLQLADSKMDSSIALVCFPETALVGGLDENRLNDEVQLSYLKSFEAKWPHVSVLTGAESYKLFKVLDELPVTARKYNEHMYYDSYNTALMSHSKRAIQLYHKSKLVPGVEKMPYPKLFGFLEKWAINLGGTSGSLGSDPEPVVFQTATDAVVAPVICYESVYGEFVSTYVSKGAQLICIITNDGWWGNTPGYRQHFDFAKLRAIENRRFIARSANTGISGFIDDKGNVLSQTDWWQPDAISATLRLNNEQTFYTEHGDVLAKIAFLLWLWRLVTYYRRKEPQAL